jgi:hypothetical protein
VIERASGSSFIFPSKWIPYAIHMDVIIEFRRKLSSGKRNVGINDKKEVADRISAAQRITCSR